MGKKALKKVDSGFTAEEHGRIAFLAERADEGELTAEERTEYRRLIQRMHTSAIRKAAEHFGDSSQTQEQLRRIQERTKRRTEDQGGTVDEIERLVFAGED